MPFWDVTLLGNSNFIVNLPFPHIDQDQNVTKYDVIMTQLLRRMLDCADIGLLRKKGPIRALSKCTGI